MITLLRISTSDWHRRFVVVAVDGLWSRLLAILLVHFAVVGCSSSGGGSSLPVDRLPPPPLGVFDSYEAAGLQLTRAIVGEAPTLEFSLPASGVVAYSGVVGFGYDSVRLAGSAQLTVDFDSNELSGLVDEIASSSGDLFVGSLSLDDLSLNMEADLNRDFSVTGTMSGELINQESASLVVEAEILGDFFRGGEIFSGVLEGNVAIGESHLPMVNGVIIAEGSF